MWSMAVGPLALWFRLAMTQPAQPCRARSGPGIPHGTPYHWETDSHLDPRWWSLLKLLFHIYIYMYVYSGMYIYIAKGILQKKHSVVFPAAFGRVSRRRSDKLKEFNALRDRISKDDVVSCFGHLAWFCLLGFAYLQTFFLAHHQPSTKWFLSAFNADIKTLHLLPLLYNSFSGFSTRSGRVWNMRIHNIW